MNCWVIYLGGFASENNLGSTSDGNGIGDFTSYLTELPTNTTYFVRAYATNSAGISYGDQVHFTTLPSAETISTTEVTDFSAKVAGYVVIGGGECNTTKHPRWSLIGNQHGVDEFGFSGLPGGEISYQNYTHLGTHGYWWSSSEGTNISLAHFFSLYYSTSFVIPGSHYRYAGLSVRCIKNID